MMAETWLMQRSRLEYLANPERESAYQRMMKSRLERMVAPIRDLVPHDQEAIAAALERLDRLLAALKEIVGKADAGPWPPPYPICKWMRDRAAQAIAEAEAP